jgi:hypothetical protein
MVKEMAVAASPRAKFSTSRGRRTQAAIDAAARSVIARKGILATTFSTSAAEAGKSTASFCKRSCAATEPGLSDWARSYRAVKHAQQQGFYRTIYHRGAA